MTIPLTERRAWIFDLDGTLTRPIIDFSVIRRELEIPDGQDILTHLSGLPSAEATEKHCLLEALEAGYAQQAQAGEGVHELLDALQSHGCQLGILTRNSKNLAHISMRAIGIDKFFADEHVLGRDEARPKPHPEGIERLLEQWCYPAAAGVMVGDFCHDLNAGRAAGVMTVHIQHPGSEIWPQATDLRVSSLGQLHQYLLG